jgi:hypothetical protein
VPQIAAFDLPSTLLPPPASLPGSARHSLLALVHSPGDDEFTATETAVDPLSVNERKAALKTLTVVRYTGPLPPAGPPEFPTLEDVLEPAAALARPVAARQSGAEAASQETPPYLSRSFLAGLGIGAALLILALWVGRETEQRG